MALWSGLFSRKKSFRHYLGIEITDSHIKIAEVEIRSRRLAHVNKAVMEKLPSGVMEDGRIIDPVRLLQTLKHVIQTNSFSTRRVHMIVPSQSIIVRQLSLPLVPDKQMRKLLEFDLKHTIHLPFEKPFFDFINMTETLVSPKTVPIRGREHSKKQTELHLFMKEAAPSLEGASHTFQRADRLSEAVEGEGHEEAPKADVMLIAAPTELVERVSLLIRQCGLKPISAEIKALSIYRVLAFTKMLQKDESTFVTVDMNDTVTELSIFHNGHLKITRSVPISFVSSGAFPESADGLMAQFFDKDAEFHNACSELAHELERLMNFYRYTLNNRSHEFQTLVLTGDISRLAEVQTYLEERLNLRAAVLRSDKIQMGKVPSGSLTDFVVPIGLALRGSEA